MNYANLAYEIYAENIFFSVTTFEGKNNIVPKILDSNRKLKNKSVIMCKGMSLHSFKSGFA